MLLRTLNSAKRVPFRRYLASYSPNTQVEIKTLEDLAKLKSLDDVDPKLISKLINQKTNELNVKNELQMLKRLQQEEQKTQETPLKKFVRPAWIFLLMGSIVYLSGHYLWWKLDYEEKELEYIHQVKELESKLNSLREAHQSSVNNDLPSGNKQNAKRWYKFW
ncbi:Mitochondrial protein FMP14 [Kluyveromyces marxianus]